MQRTFDNTEHTVLLVAVFYDIHVPNYLMHHRCCVIWNKKKIQELVLTCDGKAPFVEFDSVVDEMRYNIHLCRIGPNCPF